MSQRGKASTGDKTVLDSVAAVEAALAAGPATVATAPRAAGDALDAFRDKPNRIGRARMFAEKTIGLEDPGMVAFKAMIDALTDTAA